MLKNVQYEITEFVWSCYQMPQTVPTAAGFSPSFDYTTFQFDLSLLSDDYNTAQSQTNLKPPQIKQEVCSPRPLSPTTYPSPPYSDTTERLSPNYSRDNSPVYPTSPYYTPRSPQSAQLCPTSPEPTKQPVKREKSLDLLTILQESRWDGKRGLHLIYPCTITFAS